MRRLIFHGNALDQQTSVAEFRVNDGKVEATYFDEAARRMIESGVVRPMLRPRDGQAFYDGLIDAFSRSTMYHVEDVD